MEKGKDHERVPSSVSLSMDGLKKKWFEEGKGGEKETCKPGALLRGKPTGKEKRDMIVV